VKIELDIKRHKYHNSICSIASYHMHPVAYLSETAIIIASGSSFIENNLVLNYMNLSTLKCS